MSSEGDEALKPTDPSASLGVHASLTVALEHPSGTVRARAVEQLSKAVSESAAEVGGSDGSLGGEQSCSRSVDACVVVDRVLHFSGVSAVRASYMK